MTPRHDSGSKGRALNFFETHDEMISRLITHFAGYSISVDKVSIRRWIRNFDESDWGLALRLLETVDYYAQDRVIRECRTLHNQIRALVGNDLQRVFFCEYGHAAKSSGDIIHKYRMANGLDGEIWQSNFPRLSDLSRREPPITADSTIVLIDDFVGSGDTIMGVWDNIRASIPDNPRIYFLTLAATSAGKQRVEHDTQVQDVTNKVLAERDGVLSEENRLFSQPERDRLKDYCRRAGGIPLGWGGFACVIIFFYRSPDNTISLLWSDENDWYPLFPRYL